ncbi:MAG TPA: hypothetical protein VFB25_06990 [Gaiellaceae bacterium]|nr:hypothetical protein [Gaiellaceae bacterium]
MRVQQTDPSLADPDASAVWVTRCRDCGRERTGGTVVSLALVAVALAASIVCFIVVSPFLGAVLLVGAVSGLRWSMGPAMFERVARWLSFGR